jgi:hypothetical protein
MTGYLGDLPAQTALVRASSHLEMARNSKDRYRAKKYCDETKELLMRIDVKATSPSDLGQVIYKYRELGAILESVIMETRPRSVTEKQTN